MKYLYLKPDIIIQDYRLQGISGINVLQRTKKLLPFTEFIFLSSQENIEIAVNTIKNGAFDYIIKNELAISRLLQKIEAIIKLQQQKKRKRAFLSFLIITVFLIITGLLIGKYYR